MRGGDRFGGVVQDDQLDCVADIATIKYVGDVGQRNHHEPAGVSGERGFDALLNGEERQRVLVVHTVGVAHRDADLAHASQTFLDQSLVPGMKRLITAEEHGRGLLRVERRAQLGQGLLGPVLRRAFGTDAKVIMRGRNEKAIGVLEATSADAIDPNREGGAEGGASLRGRADEIGDHRAACLHHPITHPSHAARMLDAIGVAKAEIAREVLAHRVGIENDCIEERRQRARERGLARPGQAKYKNLHQSSRTLRWRADDDNCDLGWRQSDQGA
jgi:hypothetical protein